MRRQKNERRRLALVRIVDELCNGVTAKLADKIGVSDSYAARMLYEEGKDGKKNIGEEMADRIVLAFNLDSGALDAPIDQTKPHAARAKPPGVTKQSDVEDAPAIVGALRKLQVVGRVQAGPDGLLHIDDFAPGHGDGYMLWWATCADAYALRIRGESMSPRYLPGEFVGVDPCSDVTPNDEVIVILKDDRRMIKRLLWQRDDQACFESVNKNFPNIVLDLEEIEQMHLVLGNIPKAAFRSE